MKRVEAIVFALFNLVCFFGAALAIGAIYAPEEWQRFSPGTQRILGPWMLASLLYCTVYYVIIWMKTVMVGPKDETSLVQRMVVWWRDRREERKMRADERARLDREHREAIAIKYDAKWDYACTRVYNGHGIDDFVLVKWFNGNVIGKRVIKRVFHNIYTLVIDFDGLSGAIEIPVFYAQYCEGVVGNKLRCQFYSEDDGKSWTPVVVPPRGQ